MSRGIYIYIILACVFFSCRKKVEVEYIYNPTYVTLEVPDNFPPLEIPQENPLTEEGILLGRHLFWDTKLSGDNSLACASCHLPQHAFSDPNPLSIGVNGHLGKRNAMVLSSKKQDMVLYQHMLEKIKVYDHNVWMYQQSM